MNLSRLAIQRMKKEHTVQVQMLFIDCTYHWRFIFITVISPTISREEKVFFRYFWDIECLYARRSLLRYSLSTDRQMGKGESSGRPQYLIFIHTQLGKVKLISIPRSCTLLCRIFKNSAECVDCAKFKSAKCCFIFQIKIHQHCYGHRNTALLCNSVYKNNYPQLITLSKDDPSFSIFISVIVITIPLIFIH